MADQTFTSPNGWETTTLGDILEIRNGKSRPGDGKKFPVYGGNGILGFADEFNIDEELIIVGRVGAYCGCIYFEKDKFWLSDNALGVKEKENSNIHFLYYLLKKLNLNKQAIGGAQPLLTQGVINQIEVLYPSDKNEQQAIAAVLSSLDDKIELLREQNKTLEATAQTIFKEWFVNFNFPGATGKMIDSELGEIPEGWRVGTVNDFIERYSITYRCDKSDLSSKGKTPIIDQGSTGLYGYTEREPDFQADKSNPVILFTNHTCNMWFINYPFCAIQNVIPFRGNTTYSSFFVYYMTLGRIHFIEYKGHWPDFEQKKYVIPKPEIAHKFAESIKPLQYKIWNNNSQIQTLINIRDTLLPRLMRGELRVKSFSN